MGIFKGGTLAGGGLAGIAIEYKRTGGMYMRSGGGGRCGLVVDATHESISTKR